MIRRLLQRLSQLDRLAKMCIAGGIVLTLGVGIFLATGREPEKRYVLEFQAQEISDDADDLKKSLKAEAARAAYEGCLNAAQFDHELNWSNKCEDVARHLGSRRTACLTDRSIMTNPYMGKSYCDKAFGVVEISARCALPRTIGESVNLRYEKDEAKCIADTRAKLK